MRVVDSPSKPHEIVAGEVRAEMARRKITQQGLSAELGWTQQRLSRRITGEVPFDIAELTQIADALGVPITHFLRTPGTERVA